MDDRRNEKTYYYNKSKLVSLHVSAWKDDQQEFKLYDLKGKLTYEFKSVLKSYSVSVEIKSFHPNGAVNQVSVHMNPGASMYMYQTEYTFSDQNEPLTKEDFTTPTRLEDFMNNVSTWNKDKRQWEKYWAILSKSQMPFAAVLLGFQLWRHYILKRNCDSLQARIVQPIDLFDSL